MKRRDLIREVRSASAERGLLWVKLRQGGEHEVWACGPLMIALPRHRELTPGVVADVRRKLESVLGKGWWT